MIGFKELSEATSETYQYYPARSTKANKFFVIDMQGKSKDIVVSFTTDTKSNIGDASKKTWFATVSAMKNRNGGKVILNVEDEDALAATVAKVISDFVLKYKAKTVSTRIHRKAINRSFDIKLKQILLKYRLRSDMTKLVIENGKEAKSPYTFFVIGKPLDTITEAEAPKLIEISTVMAAEEDPSTLRAVVVTSGAKPGFSDDEISQQWIEDTPAAKVPSNPLELPEQSVDFVNSNTQKNIILRETASKDQPTTLLGESATALLDMSYDIVTASTKLDSYFEGVDELESASVANALIETMSNRRYKQYKSLISESEENDIVKKYCRSKHLSVNKALTENVEAEKYSSVIQELDKCFAESGNMLSDTTLYRGTLMNASTVSKMIESGIFATTAFMSASTDPRMVTPFVRINESTTNKMDIIESLKGKVSVAFIIEGNLPVFVPGKSGVLEECEVIVNRNTPFNVNIVSADKSGSSIVIRLSEYSEGRGVIDLMQTTERLQALNPLVDMLSRSTLKTSDELSAKHKSSIK